MIIKNLKQSNNIIIETGDIISTSGDNYFFVAFNPHTDEYTLVGLTTYEILGSWERIDWIEIGEEIHGYTITDVIKDKNIELILH